VGGGAGGLQEEGGRKITNPKFQIPVKNEERFWTPDFAKPSSVSRMTDKKT
jgi:hypothetical protein